MVVRAKVEHLYSCQELNSRVCCVGMKFMLPPTLLSMSLAIIVAAFISTRFTELSLHFYIIFPFRAFMGMFSIFWMTYDIVLITRDHEHIRGELLSHESTHLCRPLLGRPAQPESSCHETDPPSSAHRHINIYLPAQWAARWAYERPILI